MTERDETPTSEDNDAQQADADRQHAQDPVEGPDTDAKKDVPRVHPEDPAEG